MLRSLTSRALLHPLAGFLMACAINSVAQAAASPTPPRTFDSSYAPQTGATLTVGAGGDLQSALDKAQLGDTIVLQAGATFTGPYRLPNKTTGNGWVYVVSSDLSNLPPPGARVSLTNATNMPKIVAPSGRNSVSTVAGSHHYRFVGVEFAPAASATLTYQLVAIGDSDTSPTTLPHHIVFDRCYVHGQAGANHRRGIEMDGAYVAVVDSYISDFQEVGADSQGLWAYNTTGPLQIVNNYIEAAGENVMFGGADSRAADLVPADIEIRNNHLFKPLSLIGSKFTVKNLLEFKAAQRVLVTGNTLQNSPAAAQSGFALLVTPRNQNGSAPWSVTSDIAIVGNSFINVGGGVNILGTDNIHPSQQTQRILIRDNVLDVTGLNKANGRSFQVVGRGGSDYTIDHNTIINTAAPPLSAGSSDVMMAEVAAPKVNNFTFTNNLSTKTDYGFCGSGVGSGVAALNANFTNWVFSRNVLVEAPAGSYPPGNFFPNAVAAVRFVNYAGGNYALAAESPYRSAGTDGKDIGASALGSASAGVVSPNPPTDIVIR